MFVVVMMWGCLLYFFVSALCLSVVSMLAAVGRVLVIVWFALSAGDDVFKFKVCKKNDVLVCVKLVMFLSW